MNTTSVLIRTRLQLYQRIATPLFHFWNWKIIRTHSYDIPLFYPRNIHHKWNIKFDRLHQEKTDALIRVINDAENHCAIFNAVYYLVMQNQNQNIATIRSTFTFTQACVYFWKIRTKLGFFQHSVYFISDFEMLWVSGTSANLCVRSWGTRAMWTRYVTPASDLNSSQFRILPSMIMQTRLCTLQLMRILHRQRPKACFLLL